ncbi:ComEC/Rec2 family competence protein [Erythrobacter litoralis]|uniref:ComEC/Rec2 family competence protein n=1 Tax=Erythrobacter litoralis TaxID=39960 RepID=UPI002435A8ED|nr:ComEC/Rec2 family competence protein [Erythrobacter litoralis]
MSRLADRIEGFLSLSGFDRGPWLAVAFAAGIGAWFILPLQWQWVAFNGVVASLAALSYTIWRGRSDRTLILLSIVTITVAIAAGLATVWTRSAIADAEPIEHPGFLRMEATILELIEQPAEERVRIVVAARQPDTGKPIKVRINIPEDRVVAGMVEGARVRLGARLMPPSPPLLPGAYDFARAAWFEGYAATGSLAGEVQIVGAAPTKRNHIASIQRSLAAHVRERLDGSAGSIAAAFASGDRGSISTADEEAMRDAGLTHLLSISGLHVSAVIAAIYFLTIRVLALFPALALRVRLPLIAAALGAAAGISYTLLTGAQVPTVRSCAGAILVLGALVLGREPLSLRMVAIAAIFVLLLWPESLVGPSFQMSFAAVLAIVALHSSEPVRKFLAPRECSSVERLARKTAMLFATGVVIELALMPIVLFHFHRAGLYGAFANVLAIPLVTFVSMPLIALALFLDLFGLGAPVWFFAGLSLDAMLALAHFTATRPDAVKLIPQIGLFTVMLFVSGALWLALWRGKVRLYGLLPASFAAGLVAFTPTPDILITRDGRDVGLVDDSGKLFVLRDSEGSYARDILVELSGSEASPMLLDNWPGARCSRDFCSLTILRADRPWHILVARNRQRLDERQLSAACERAHIVIADRWLPRSCRPLWLKADGRFLKDNGGTAIYLGEEHIVTSEPPVSDHGWKQSAGSRYQ